MASESKQNQSETSLDLPPESFLVSRDEEEDWVIQNAMMQRKTSFKIGCNKKKFSSFSQASEANVNRKTKGISSFAIPKTAHEKKPVKQLFRSWSEPGMKPVVQIREPVSPKVSCTGRVGSKRGQRKKASSLAQVLEPGGSPKISCIGRVGSTRDGGKKRGLSRLFSSMFRTGSKEHASIRKGNDNVG